MGCVPISKNTTLRNLHHNSSYSAYIVLIAVPIYKKMCCCEFSIYINIFKIFCLKRAGLCS